MADNAQPIHPQERRGADLGVVHPSPEPTKRSLRQEVPEPGCKRACQLLPQKRFDNLHKSLADLQRDVAREPIAYDHVGLACVDVSRLNIADEVEPTREQPLMRIADQVVPLVASFPVDKRPTVGLAMPSDRRA